MQERSSNSRVHKWPDRDAVEAALRRWIPQELLRHPEAIRIGYFGSYARGDWSVGSDVDLIAIVRDSSRPFGERAIEWDLLNLPVPADLLVYTGAEWSSLESEDSSFARAVAHEAVWLWQRDAE